MADNEYAGSALYASWVYSGGTFALETESRNFTYTPSIAFIDATAGADVNIRRINSFKDGNVTIETLAQTDGTVVLTACSEGVPGTLTWGEAGTVAGRAKHTMAAIAGGVTIGTPYNDVVTYSISFQQNGTRTDSVWP